MTLDDDQAEDRHRAQVIATFDRYLQHSMSANRRRRSDYYALRDDHQALLPGYTDLLNDVDDALLVNHALVRAMADQTPFPPSPDAALSSPAPTEAEHERLRSTLRQCVRDWSDAGKEERDSVYVPILEALDESFRNFDRAARANMRVLVPGAGLARLPWEIIRLGFSCQANEFSLYMIIASSLFLNNAERIDQYTLYPHVHTFSNTRNKQDLLKAITLPDVLATDTNASQGDFSFAAGDWLEIYGNDEDSWDSVITCFFIDTARNIVEYLELIWKVLKPGGKWVNCGPTLWHFENTEGARSIELMLDDVKALARRIGFELTEEREIETRYTTNQQSMLRYEYSAAFWVATKVSKQPNA
ncbi:hypothetical protein OIO90_002228 [Microbotryomycetes sp. JL221]|nr:hypothetical protein OIO90_002228 [Microbotryomycetes sp. JL221]